MDYNDIDSRIEELEQRIAEKKAIRKYYQPNSHVSKWDYIAGNDRSGLDKMSADMIAYNNMLAQHAQQNKMLKAQQAQQNLMQNSQFAQQDKMLKSQQDFTAAQNALNRDNALEIAKQNKTERTIADVNNARNKLTELIIAKQALDAQGKDSRLVSAQIEDLYKRYPDIEKVQVPEYDETQDVDYILAQSAGYNAIDNPLTEGEETIESILDKVKQFHTPEAAKERVRLEKEIKKRNLAIEYKDKINDAINEYYKTGEMPNILTQAGFEEAGTSKNRFLIRGKKHYKKGTKF